jgi:hypothetical protein
MASLSPEIEERTVTLMAPSKTFNLPGLKCAIGIVPNAALRERLTAAVADMVPKINVLGHAAAVAAYRDGDSWLEALLHYLASNRDFLAAEIPRRLPGVKMAPAEGTYLAWLDCREAPIPGGDPYTFFLERAKVALNDGKLFGPGGEGFVRLSTLPRFAAGRQDRANGASARRGLQTNAASPSPRHPGGADHPPSWSSRPGSSTSSTRGAWPRRAVDDRHRPSALARSRPRSPWCRRSRRSARPMTSIRRPPRLLQPGAVAPHDAKAWTNVISPMQPAPASQHAVSWAAACASPPTRKTRRVAGTLTPAVSAFVRPGSEPSGWFLDILVPVANRGAGPVDRRGDRDGRCATSSCSKNSGRVDRRSSTAGG